MFGVIAVSPDGAALLLSYLLQVKVLYRHDISTGRQGAHQRSQHLEQRVPHDFSLSGWLLRQRVKYQDEVRRRRQNEAPYMLLSIPSFFCFCLLLILFLQLLAFALQNTFGLHTPACKLQPLYNFSRVDGGGDVRWAKEWIYNFFTNVLVCLESKTKQFCTSANFFAKICSKRTS